MFRLRKAAEVKPSLRILLNAMKQPFKRGYFVFHLNKFIFSFRSRAQPIIPMESLYFAYCKTYIWILYRLVLRALSKRNRLIRLFYFCGSFVTVSFFACLFVCLSVCYLVKHNFWEPESNLRTKFLVRNKRGLWIDVPYNSWYCEGALRQCVRDSIKNKLTIDSCHLSKSS